METNIPTPVAGDEPYLDRIYHALTVLPVVVGFLFTGLVGGIIGTVMNRWLAQRPIRAPLKLTTMLGVALLATAGSFALAYATAPIPKLETGGCVMGIKGAKDVTTRNTRPVDCAMPHDSEVVGVVPYPGDGSYPGDDTMNAFPDEPCLVAFETYVGIAFESSSLEMTLVIPTDSTWARGDRGIACVVFAGGDGQLTGSVKGTAR